MQRRSNYQLDSEKRMTERILWSIIAVVVIGAVAYYFMQRASRVMAPAPPPPAAATAPKPAPAAAKPPAQHFPVPESTPEVPAKPLPALAVSDAEFRGALLPVIGDAAVNQFLVSTDIIRHIVATLDNLTAEKASTRLWPINPTPGKFMIAGSEPELTLDVDNFSRYTPLVRVVAALDTKQLVALYFHYYPLFQEAYANLGHPSGYFNDRLVQVIDHLVTAPDAPETIRLIHPSVYYKFADPKLEALSAGRKIMIRIGPVNAAVVKAKLKEIRALVAAHGVPQQ